MKCLEKSVKTEVLKQAQHLLHPPQFAYRHWKVVEDATHTSKSWRAHISRKKNPMPYFCLLIFHQRLIPFILTYCWRSSHLTLSWALPQPCGLSTSCLRDLGECVWMIVCPIQCAYPLLHLKVASCLHCFTSGIQMIAGVAVRTYFSLRLLTILLW